MTVHEKYEVGEKVMLIRGIVDARNIDVLEYYGEATFDGTFPIALDFDTAFKSFFRFIGKPVREDELSNAMKAWKKIDRPSVIHKGRFTSKTGMRVWDFECSSVTLGTWDRLVKEAKLKGISYRMVDMPKEEMKVEIITPNHNY